MESSRVPFLITASAPITAPADRIYRIIADYKTGHPGILPKPFGALIVEEGGMGAGTTIRCSLRVMGRTQTFRAEILEPEPGRVLVERNLGSPESVTTFTVERQGDHASDVTISTEFMVRRGIVGAIERFMMGRFLRPIYHRELKLLADRATS